MNQEKSSELQYTVLINHEEQYSIWPAHKEVPTGWNKVDITGSKQDCLDYIDEHWKDMRPLSLRKAMSS